MLGGLLRHVDAAHALRGAGICEQPHGHTYRVEAVFMARLQNQGQAALDRELAVFDHRDLNQSFEFASCEHFCLELARNVEKAAPGALWSLRVWEGEGKWAEALRPDFVALA